MKVFRLLLAYLFLAFVGIASAGSGLVLGHNAIADDFGGSIDAAPSTTEFQGGGSEINTGSTGGADCAAAGTSQAQCQRTTQLTHDIGQFQHDSNQVLQQEVRKIDNIASNPDMGSKAQELQERTADRIKAITELEKAKAERNAALAMFDYEAANAHAMIIARKEAEIAANTDQPANQAQLQKELEVNKKKQSEANMGTALAMVSALTGLMSLAEHKKTEKGLRENAAALSDTSSAGATTFSGDAPTFRPQLGARPTDGSTEAPPLSNPGPDGKQTNLADLARATQDAAIGKDLPPGTPGGSDAPTVLGQPSLKDELLPNIELKNPARGPAADGITSGAGSGSGIGGGGSTEAIAGPQGAHLAEGSDEGYAGGGGGGGGGGSGGDAGPDLSAMLAKLLPQNAEAEERSKDGIMAFGKSGVPSENRQLNPPTANLFTVVSRAYEKKQISWAKQQL